MNKLLVTLFAVGVLSINLAACSSSTATGPVQPLKPSPTPCVTVTPATGSAASVSSAVSTPAGRTSSTGAAAGVQSTVSPAELATREAQLAKQNRPVGVPTAEQTKTLTLSICPTPTPVK